MLDLALLATRGVILGIGDPRYYIGHCILDIIFLSMVIKRERGSRDVYVNFSESKNQLLKFRDLIGNHLPQSVIVVNDEGELLFENKAY